MSAAHAPMDVSASASSSSSPASPYLIRDTIEDEERRAFASELVVSLINSMITYVIATYPMVNGDHELSFEGYMFLIAAVADIPRHFSDLVEDSDWFGGVSHQLIHRLCKLLRLKPRVGDSEDDINYNKELLWKLSEYANSRSKRHNRVAPSPIAVVEVELLLLCKLVNRESTNDEYDQVRVALIKYMSEPYIVSCIDQLNYTVFKAVYRIVVPSHEQLKKVTESNANVMIRARHQLKSFFVANPANVSAASGSHVTSNSSNNPSSSQSRAPKRRSAPVEEDGHDDGIDDLSSDVSGMEDDIIDIPAMDNKRGNNSRLGYNLKSHAGGLGYNPKSGDGSLGYNPKSNSGRGLKDKRGHKHGSSKHRARSVSASSSSGSDSDSSSHSRGYHRAQSNVRMRFSNATSPSTSFAAILSSCAASFPSYKYYTSHEIAKSISGVRNLRELERWALVLDEMLACSIDVSSTVFELVSRIFTGIQITDTNGDYESLAAMIGEQSQSLPVQVIAAINKHRLQSNKLGSKRVDDEEKKYGSRKNSVPQANGGHRGRGRGGGFRGRGGRGSSTGSGGPASATNTAAGSTPSA